MASVTGSSPAGACLRMSSSWEAVKAVLTREVTLFISAAAPGQPGGDMDTANRMTDDVLRVLTWSALGYAGRIICKPRQAAPLPIVWEDAPGRAVWSMTIDVTCLENEF